MRPQTLEPVRSTIVLLTLATLALAATSASAELTPWNQEQVTAIAGELHEKTRDLRDTLRRQPAPTLGQPGKRAFFRLRDELGSIDSSARRLHSALAAGEGRDETFPTYRRMILSVRNAARELRRMDLGEPANGRIQAAADVLRRLRPYFEEEPPL